jgi:hypothetical protein
MHYSFSGVVKDCMHGIYIYMQAVCAHVPIWGHDWMLCPFHTPAHLFYQGGIRKTCSSALKSKGTNSSLGAIMHWPGIICPSIAAHWHSLTQALALAAPPLSAMSYMSYISFATVFHLSSARACIVEGCAHVEALCGLLVEYGRPVCCVCLVCGTGNGLMPYC